MSYHLARPSSHLALEVVALRILYLGLNSKSGMYPPSHDVCEMGIHQKLVGQVLFVWHVDPVHFTNVMRN